MNASGQVWCPKKLRNIEIMYLFFENKFSIFPKKAWYVKNWMGKSWFHSSYLRVEIIYLNLAVKFEFILHTYPVTAEEKMMQDIYQKLVYYLQTSQNNDAWVAFSLLSVSVLLVPLKYWTASYHFPEISGIWEWKTMQLFTRFAKDKSAEKQKCSEMILELLVSLTILTVVGRKLWLLCHDNTDTNLRNTFTENLI